MIHKIKILEEFATQILNGKKTFEIRFNNRNYKEGDLIKFNVIDDRGNNIKHSLNKETFIIDYLLNGWGLQEGHVAFSIKNIKDTNNKCIGCVDCDYRGETIWKDEKSEKRKVSQFLFCKKHNMKCSDVDKNKC